MFSIRQCESFDILGIAMYYIYFFEPSLMVSKGLRRPARCAVWLVIVTIIICTFPNSETGCMLVYVIYTDPTSAAWIAYSSTVSDPR